MCYSPTVSFEASAVLLIAGAATVKQSDKRKELPFALIPFLFAFQQFCEGMIWLTFSNQSLEQWRGVFTYTFLVFAQVIWPFWVPYSVYLLGRENVRKNFLFSFLMIGIGLSVYLGCNLLFFPVRIDIGSGHIRYLLDSPYRADYLTGTCYFIATVLPVLVSGVKKMIWTGSLLFTSFLFALVFYRDSLISVWCYFAALISISIYFVLRKNNNQAE
jgi:hypothetical protein